jgi:hypothetical protein
MLKTNIEVWRLTLFSSLGLLPLSCAATQPNENTNTADGFGRSEGATETGDAAAGGASASAALSVAFECSNDEEVLTPSGNVTGKRHCSNGVVHRATEVQCVSELPRASDGADDTGLYAPNCAKDSECTAGANGFCGTVPFNGGFARGCVYGCVTNNDCDAGFVCECGSPVGTCVEASCTTDSDCTDGLLCALWTAHATCGEPIPSYACQHPDDSCLTDADCAGQNETCDAANSPRRCVAFPLPPCGRPFLIHGSEQLATVRSGYGWLSKYRKAGPSSLDATTATRLAKHWTDNALMEHASIAAFARFTLQLLQLGAPRELVEASQRAMADETEHARLCFTLASRYHGEALGPGLLPIAGALDPTSLFDIVQTALHEGCVGETVAALEAAEALAHARDTEVCTALTRIQADELRHAELAWRFLTWALSNGGEELAQRVRQEFATLRQSIEEHAPLTSEQGGSKQEREHGLLPLHIRSQLRRRALSNVVLPCAKRLLQQATLRPRPPSSARQTAPTNSA